MEYSVKWSLLLSLLITCVLPASSFVHQWTSQREISIRSSLQSTESPLLIHPTSEQAQNALSDLGIDESKFDTFTALCDAIVEWNERINLVSRKDCSPPTVFTRHVLPCAAAHGMSELESCSSLIDVGTGGGFPGLVLAILYPDTHCVLLDSVGKKLGAVQDIADSLGLTNVQTHHGRAEEFANQRFQVATGRSVSAIPQFCAWMQHLLEPDGNLLYWIGGDVPEDVLSLATSDSSVASRVPALQESDKRIIVLDSPSVTGIAKSSGLLKEIPVNRSQRSTGHKTKKKATSRGEWKRRQQDFDDEPKQRGYETFQRYSSNN